MKVEDYKKRGVKNYKKYLFSHGLKNNISILCV